MELEALPIKVRRKLAETGTRLEQNGNYPLSKLSLGRRELALANGIDYDVTLTNTGEAILLAGNATAIMLGKCERCLEDALFEIKGDVEGYYLFYPPSREAQKDDYSQGTVDSEGRVDIAPEIVAAIVVELPTVLLCSPDCPGVEI